jgi:hypothetical protein
MTGRARVGRYPPGTKLSQRFPASFLFLSPVVSVTSTVFVALPLHLMGSPEGRLVKVEKQSGKT